MPTRCNRGFYCRSYCLLNMFRTPLFPSSGAQEYYTVVAACGISCCGFQVAGLVWSWGLCVRFAGCSSRQHRQQPLYNILELLMMGIMVPEACWASNKICNKKPLLYLVGILFPHINKDARSKSHHIETSSMYTCLSVFVMCRVLNLSDNNLLSVIDASSQCVWAVRQTGRVNTMNKPTVNGKKTVVT